MNTLNKTQDVGTVGIEQPELKQIFFALERQSNMLNELLCMSACIAQNLKNFEDESANNYLPQKKATCIIDSFWEVVNKLDAQTAQIDKNIRHALQIIGVEPY